jgi:hypothetical protein
MIFASIYTSITLIQGQGRIFSINSVDSPHKIIPEINEFWKKNRIFVDFRFYIHFIYPNLGKHFQASGMLAVDSSHQIIPKYVVFRRKNHTQNHVKSTRNFVPSLFTLFCHPKTHMIELAVCLLISVRAGGKTPAIQMSLPLLGSAKNKKHAY